MSIRPRICRYHANASWPWLLALFVVGMVPRVILSFGSVPLLWPDSLTYLGSAAAMADEGNYWQHEVYRTPMYPLFLAMFFKVWGHATGAGDAMIAAQRVLGLLSGLLLFCIIRRAFSERVAFGAATLFLLCPLQLYYETVLLTEAQFTFLLFIFLYVATGLVAGADQSDRGMWWLRFVALGSSGALLSLSRPIGQLLLIGFLLAFVALRRGSRRAVLGAVLSALVFVATIFPWLQINHHYYGFWGISRDFGINLYHRVIDVDQTPLPRESSDVFIRKAYRSARKYPGVTYFRVYYALRRQLALSRVPRRLHGLTADRRMGNFAVEVLMAHPQTFIPYSMRNFWQLFMSPRRSLHFCAEADGSPYLCTNHEGLASRSVQASPGPVSVRARRVVHTLMAALRIPDRLFAVFAVIGATCALFRGCRIQSLFLASIVVYFTGLAALMNCPEDRFRVPVDGLIYGFAVYGLGQVVSFAVRSRRSGVTAH